MYRTGVHCTVQVCRANVHCSVQERKTGVQNWSLLYSTSVQNWFFVISSGLTCEPAGVDVVCAVALIAGAEEHSVTVCDKISYDKITR